MSGADLTGHPTVSASNCSFTIGHMDINFHGGARFCMQAFTAVTMLTRFISSWLYNLFSGSIADDLKGSIAGSVCY